MYRSYFGLNRLPFKVTPDPEFFFGHADRDAILQALLYSIQRGDPIIKVVGDVGCGKTTLLRLLISQLRNVHFALIYVSSPNLSPKDILFYICQELSIDVEPSLHKFQVVELLTQKLLSLHREGKQVVMLVDEAQTMPVDTLEEIRLLTNLETHTEKLLQIVLFGQPELDTTLSSSKLRQLKSRIAYSLKIAPLSPEDVKRYLNFRMRKAGYQDEDLFDQSVAKRIHKITRGLPRDINFLADKLLMSAFNDNAKKVQLKHFKSLDLPASSTKLFMMGGAIFVLILFMIGYFLLKEQALEGKVVSSTGSLTKASSNNPKSLQTSPVNQTMAAPVVTNRIAPQIKPSSQEPPSKASPPQTNQEPIPSSPSSSGPLVSIANQIVGPKASDKQRKLILSALHQSSFGLPNLFNSKYTVLLYQDRLSRAAQVYQRFKSGLPVSLQEKIYLIPDLTKGKFLLFLDYNNLATPLRREIHSLPEYLLRAKPYVVTIKHFHRLLSRYKELSAVE